MNIQVQERISYNNYGDKNIDDNRRTTICGLSNRHYGSYNNSLIASLQVQKIVEKVITR